MRASRLLSVLLLLQARGRMTAPQLARELEVSVRTVYRDVESLAAAGVPVYAERGPAGGYRLLDGYRTRLTGLTAGEAESLFLAGPPGAAAELGLGGVLAAAHLKLLAALPPELRERAGRVRERFILDVPGWFHDIERPPLLPAVADAVWNGHVLRVRYERWGRQVVTRRLEPYGLVLKAGVWYLVAKSAGTARTYRIARIHALETLDETFRRDPGLDLSTYWQEWAEEYRARLYQDEATVRLSPFARDLLPFYLGPAAARAATETARSDKHGWTRVVIPIESLRHGCLALLRFGPDAEVLGPPELRAMVAEAARKTAAIYR